MRVSGTLVRAAALVGVLACNREVAPPKRATHEASARQEAASLKPEGLRWNGSDVALNSSAKLPRLRWRLRGSGRGQTQTAYQVLVASDLTQLAAGNGDVWDSGKVNSVESLDILYGGAALNGRQRGVWTVRTWDEHDRPSSYAPPEGWEITPWDEEVEGHWIGRRQEPGTAGRGPDHSVTYVRKVISVPQGFQSAHLYATAFGVYEASINGQRVGEDVLAPGFTEHEKRSLVQRHEVTSLLRAGENVLGAVVAGGWCTARLGGTLGACGLEPPRVRLALELTLADGKREAFESDDSWKYQSGPIRSARIYGGEEYDARREFPGWDAPGFDDQQWRPVAKYDDDTERMVYHDPGPALRVSQELEPRESEPERGVYLFDMGRPISGWAKISVRAPAGTQILLRYGSQLGADGTLKGRAGVDGDRYTAGGSDVESWEPRFALHRFRYVEVRGLPARAALVSLAGRAVHTQMATTGTLETSNPRLNQLFASAVFTQESAFTSVPSSGREPSERPGSLLQASAMALSGCLNRDVQGFYRKWLGDIRDAQLENGGYTIVAPGREALEAGGSAGAAGVLLPWAHHLCYGDRSALEIHATSMGRWIERVKAQNPDLIWKNGLGTEPGDPGETGAGTDRVLLATAELSHAAFLVAQMLRYAGGGLKAEAGRYEAVAREAKAAFNRAFVLPDGRLRSDTQTAYAVALERGVLEGAALERAGEYLAATVERVGRRPTTGLVATALLLPALSRVLRDDLAYALLATMSDADSNQHPARELAFAGVGAWMYDAIGGIALDPSAPAGRHVLVRPRPGGGVTRAKASFDSAYGRITTDWRLEGPRFHLNLVLPPGSSATVTLPLSGSIREGGLPLARASGAKLVHSNARGSVLEVEAGSYAFEVEQQ